MSTTRRLTADEFLAGDFPRGAQLIEGKVIVNDQGFWHQELCLRVVLALRSWVESEHGDGRVGIGGNWRLDARSLYKPDVWWTAAGHEPDLASARHDVPPDVAVEVRSPGTWAHDIGPKKTVYEATGIPELWLVDGFGLAVLVFRRSTPAATKFDVDLELGAGEVLTSSLLPEFKLGVDELFADAP